MTGKGTGIAKEPQRSTVPSDVEDVREEPLDEVQVESLAVDTTGPPPEMNTEVNVSSVSEPVENLVDSRELSQEKSQQAGTIVFCYSFLVGDCHKTYLQLTNLSFLWF